MAQAMARVRVPRYGPGHGLFLLRAMGQVWSEPWLAVADRGEYLAVFFYSFFLAFDVFSGFLAVLFSGFFRPGPGSGRFRPKSGRF